MGAAARERARPADQIGNDLQFAALIIGCVGELDRHRDPPALASVGAGIGMPHPEMAVLPVAQDLDRFAERADGQAESLRRVGEQSVEAGEKPGGRRPRDEAGAHVAPGDVHDRLGPAVERAGPGRRCVGQSDDPVAFGVAEGVGKGEIGSGHARVRTRYRRWSGSAGEGGWAGEGRRAGQATRSRHSTPPAAFPGRPRSGGLSFAARLRRCVGHDEIFIAPSLLLAGQQMPTVTTASGIESGPFHLTPRAAAR